MITGLCVGGLGMTALPGDKGGGGGLREGRTVMTLGKGMDKLRRPASEGRVEGERGAQGSNFGGGEARRLSSEKGCNRNHEVDVVRLFVADVAKPRKRRKENSLIRITCPTPRKGLVTPTKKR